MSILWRVLFVLDGMARFSLEASLVSVKFPLYTDAMKWQSLCRSSEGTLRTCFTHFRYGQTRRAKSSASH